MTTFKLIIFDCDGVLVDSERIANVVFSEVLSEFGFTLSIGDVSKKMSGYPLPQCLKIVEEILGTPLPAELGVRYKDRLNDALGKNVKPVAGIEEVIKGLTIPYCVASNGSIEKMCMTLGVAKLAKYFNNRLYSATKVRRCKPYPDVYLYAAKQMSVEPSQCVVIEDTPIGVQGARLAGMTVFGYAESGRADELIEAGAHLVFDRMDLLPQFINNNVAFV